MNINYTPNVHLSCFIMFALELKPHFYKEDLTNILIPCTYCLQVTTALMILAEDVSTETSQKPFITVSMSEVKLSAVMRCATKQHPPVSAVQQPNTEVQGPPVK